MLEKLTDNEIIVITDAILVLEDLRDRTKHLDAQTFNLLIELRDALELFEL